MYDTKHAIRRFFRDETGSLAVEFLLIAPFLIWTVIAMYSFWDTFRNRNVFQKATHTVSNIISRTKKGTPLDAADVTGYFNLMNYLVAGDEQVSVRVTEYKYFAAPTNAYKMQWSCRRGSQFPSGVTDADLAAMKTTTLPIMASGDTHILLETRMAYHSPFSINFMWFGGTTAGATTGDYDFREILSERPRDGDFSMTLPC